MKNTMKKLTAGVSALAMAATLSATSVPAFAAEFESMEAQEFVNSFENPDTRTVAQYCLDNGLSLDEAKDVMDTYETGLTLIAEREITARNAINTGKAFYSEKNVAQTQHYVVLIANNGAASGFVTLNLSFSLDWINYDMTTMPYTLINENADITVGKSSNSRIRVNGDIPNVYTTSKPAGVLYLPFGIEENIASGGDTYTESSVYHKFTLTRNYYDSANNKDTTFSYETFALGDVDHSGYVDEADSTYLLQFLVHKINDLSFSYTDKSDNIANIVNFLATDTNHDGKLDLTDVTRINQWAAN